MASNNETYDKSLSENYVGESEIVFADESIATANTTNILNIGDNSSIATTTTTMGQEMYDQQYYDYVQPSYNYQPIQYNQMMLPAAAAATTMMPSMLQPTPEGTSAGNAYISPGVCNDIDYYNFPQLSTNNVYQVAGPSNFACYGSQPNPYVQPATMFHGKQSSSQPLYYFTEPTTPAVAAERPLLGKTVGFEGVQVLDDKRPSMVITPILTKIEQSSSSIVSVSSPVVPDALVKTEDKKKTSHKPKHSLATLGKAGDKNEKHKHEPVSEADKKLEQKRERNRLAARKCRDKKLNLIKEYEERLKISKEELAAEEAECERLNARKNELRLMLIHFYLQRNMNNNNNNNNSSNFGNILDSNNNNVN